MKCGGQGIFRDRRPQCNKCFMAGRTDMDRRTRCGHDRAPDKHQREADY